MWGVSMWPTEEQEGKTGYLFISVGDGKFFVVNEVLMEEDDKPQST
jgi:hypothetical protein